VVRIAVKLEQRRQVLHLRHDLLRHAAIQYGQGGDAVVAGRGRRRDMAAERETEQAEPAGAVGPRKDRGDGSRHPPAPGVEAPRVIGLAALRRGYSLKREIIGRAVVVDEIRIDAFGGQRVGITLIGARPEFDATRAVQDHDTSALPLPLRRIARQSDAAVAGRDAELFAGVGV
jgi:hypothetical protein